MAAIAMEICPLCATCPRVSGRWRLQVRCSCGACGPKMKSEDQAILRWNTVVRFMRELAQAGAAVIDAVERPDRPVGSRRLVRGLDWQCGLAPEQGF